jgi:lysophospholipase L1-like esterase
MRPLSSTPLDIRGMGEAAYSLPLWQQYQMRDLIAQATCDRDSLAYWSDTGRTYAVDELRRRRTRAGYLALIEEAGTQLGPPGGDITASPTIGGNSVLTDLGNGEYRAYLPDGSGTFFYFYDGAVISGEHTICFEWRKTPGSVETGTLTVQGQDASNAGPLYLLDATPPDEWTKVCVTESEPGTSTHLAFFDTGGVDFQIRLAQFEQNPYPTSWIPGPGTARAACDVTVPQSVLPTTQYATQFLTVWGDSTTAGDLGASTVPHVVANSVLGAAFNRGAGGETSTQIKTRFDAEPARHGDVTIIWAGHNDPTGTTAVDNIAAMVATLGHTRYAIVGLAFPSNHPDFTDGSAVNSTLSATYGSRYVDVTTALTAVAGGDTTWASFRVDALHLNAQGNKVVAAAIARTLSETMAVPYATEQALQRFSGVVFLGVKLDAFTSGTVLLSGGRDSTNRWDLSARISGANINIYRGSSFYATIEGPLTAGQEYIIAIRWGSWGIDAWLNEQKTNFSGNAANSDARYVPAEALEIGSDVPGFSYAPGVYTLKYHSGYLEDAQIAAISDDLLARLPA